MVGAFPPPAWFLILVAAGFFGSFCWRDSSASRTNTARRKFYRAPGPKDSAHPQTRLGPAHHRAIEPRRCGQRLRATDSEDEGDLITRLFKRWLPDPDDLGLKRISVDSAPEQYYATLDRWADPVQGDDATVAMFRPALAQTRMEKRQMKLCYDANRDGWDSASFHGKVDKQGAAVVFCKTVSGGVFGGYNPKGWVNYGEYRGSLAAFLYVWPGGVADAEAGSRPLKLRKSGGAGLAQVDDGSGPKFGMEDLAIPLAPRATRNPRIVSSKLGAYYERMEDGTNTLLPDGRRADTLSELKVYIGVYEEGEYIPFTDAEPFAIN